MTDEEIILSVRIEEGAKFKRIVEAISAMLTRARFEFTDVGMFIRATNDSRIGYLEMNIPVTSFDSYECVMQKEIAEDEDGNDEEVDVPVQLDLNIDDFEKIIARCGQNEAISIIHKKVAVSSKDEDRVWQPSEKVNIKIDGETASGRRRTRTFQLNQEEVPSMFIPEGDITEVVPFYNWDLEMGAEAFEEIIKDADIISDTISIKVNSDGVEFSAWSEIGNYSEPIEDGITVMKSEKAEEEVEVTCDFQIDILKNALKMGKESEDLLYIQVGTENNEPLPIRIQINFLTDAVANYYIAPKAEE